MVEGGGAVEEGEGGVADSVLEDGFAEVNEGVACGRGRVDQLREGVKETRKTNSGR